MLHHHCDERVKPTHKSYSERSERLGSLLAAHSSRAGFVRRCIGPALRRLGVSGARCVRRVDDALQPKKMPPFHLRHSFVQSILFRSVLGIVDAGLDKLPNPFSGAERIRCCRELLGLFRRFASVSIPSSTDLGLLCLALPSLPYGP